LKHRIGLAVARGSRLPVSGGIETSKQIVFVHLFETLPDPATGQKHPDLNSLQIKVKNAPI